MWVNPNRNDILYPNAYKSTSGVFVQLKRAILSHFLNQRYPIMQTILFITQNCIFFRRKSGVPTIFPPPPPKSHPSGICVPSQTRAYGLT